MSKRQTPRLIKIRGAWHCAILKGERGQWIGIGFTPRQAYDDWAAGPSRSVGRFST